jgi:hypothetical protein
VGKIPGGHKVCDANVARLWLYWRETESNARMTNVLTEDEGPRRVVSNIAKLPTLLRRDEVEGFGRPRGPTADDPARRHHRFWERCWHRQPVEEGAAALGALTAPKSVRLLAPSLLPPLAKPDRTSGRHRRHREAA